MMAPLYGLVAAAQLLSLASFAIALPNGPIRRDAAFAAAKDQSYDYVIVGGGLTGLVVANRLSEDKSTSVLVIENGYIDDKPITSIPYMASMLNVADMWPILSAPDPGLNNTVWDVRVGNVVGGGSVVNGMQWDRGADADYDAWEELGNEGWGFDGLAKYFKKSTHFTPPSRSTVKQFGITYDESAYGNGPAQVTISSFQYPDMKPIFDSWKAENLPMPQEGFADPVGIYWTPNSVDNKTATRSHARKTYYDPVSSRSNLKLLTGTKATEILFDGKGKSLKAKGVKITSRADGSTGQVTAKREVILAAGGVLTPHILMVSGIGPKDVLDAAKVPVKRDTPGVGSNFQDHVPLYMSFNLSNVAFPNPTTPTTNATFNASAAAQYEKERQGPYTFGRGNALAMLPFQQVSSNWKSITKKISQQADPTKYLPARYAKNKALLAGYKKQREVLINLYSSNVSTLGEFPVQPWGRAAVAHQKPLSRGTITLNTTDPSAAPVLTYNTLQNPIDKAVIAELVRFNRKHWARPELSQYKPVELVPGAQYKTDNEIINAAIAQLQINPSFAHPSCSAAMLPEELGGVVDSELKVYGVGRLRIVDASIIPLIPSTHLQATMYAVAEKAADIIKGV
ncbi:choline dehydrogenase-like protein [Lophiotrema nucula]|uniref:Choline dehydrogenase-like protein n=1 Tax=Lophiotrema nucula TaxID=690887 RepID=A0A6A5YMJ9_9PLEO|nr:choline dehydrogenase-like protein [Lophiotrema nucula]